MHSVSVDVVEISCGNPLMTANFAYRPLAASLADLRQNSVIAWAGLAVVVSAKLYG